MRARAGALSPDGSELWFNWIVRAAGSAVGYVQVTLRRDEAVADLAWVIGTPFQGRGYAREAALAVLNWLSSRSDVIRVTAHIAPDNTRSQQVARHGMVETPQIKDGETVWEAV